MKKIILFIALCGISLHVTAQNQPDCNKLGAWLWYIDITGFATHGKIADSLKILGVKRIYVKVADGQPNTAVWPELIDASLTAAYHQRGIEVWGWSYNYPNNPTQQAKALYTAAQTGYDGYVVDVEMEFDGLTTPLSNLFTAFAAEKAISISEGLADTTFQLYCTTWGNPMDHNFKIDLIDPHVDGYMPQTYVEQWGPSYVAQLSYWIGVGNEEYATLGATKPIHHIVALEDGNITAEQINTFIQTSGPETSLWRIPGGGVATSLWQTWNDINWNTDFCQPSSVDDLSSEMDVLLSPNPTDGLFTVFSKDEGVRTTLLDPMGRTLQQIDIQPNTNTRIDISAMPPGIYIVKLYFKNRITAKKILKQ